jgi:hypothetical protein
MLLPGAIEERDKAMVKKVEKRGEAIIFRTFACDHPFCIEEWQNALRAGETNECDRHASGIAGKTALARDIVNGARREGHGETHSEAGELLLRSGRASHRLPFPEDSSEQARSLEELELVTALEQDLL